MRHHSRRLSNSARALIAGAAALVVLSWPGVSRAQSSASGRDRLAEMEARRTEMEARQRALRSLGNLAKKPARKPPDMRPSYRDVAKDFEQLQVRNYQLSQSVGSATSLDYARIRDEAAEIKKIASRLKSTFRLPAGEEGQKQKKPADPLTPEGLKAAVASLDEAVKSFVWNPVFQRPDVLDVDNAAKAARSLEDILKGSEQIKDSAATLSKSAGSK